MDAVRELLRQKSSAHPGNEALSSALIVLDELAHTGSHPATTSRTVELLAGLETQGLWGTTDDERALRDSLETELHSSSSPGRFTIVAPPPATPRGLQWTTDSGHALVVDPALGAQLNEVAFLHILATAPSKVVPPGKSLRAALASPEAVRALDANGSGVRTHGGQSNGTSAAPPTLQEKVEEIAQRAFWDEALESLADPTPAHQLARLKRLYADLHAALQAGALLPSRHPSMVTLSAPLSPTPAPLRSARRHLAELTAALRTRCAPVRDDALDAVLASLNHSSRPSSPSARSFDSRSQASSDDEASSSSVPGTRSPALPARIVSAVKDLLRIAELMKSDLASAALATVSDDELTAEIARTACEAERRTVRALYGSQDVRDRWQTWVGSTPLGLSTAADAEQIEERWLHRLVQALGADVAVSCPLPNPSSSPPSSTSPERPQGIPTTNTTAASPTTDRNTLPPPFLFSLTELLHLQNRLQALVIAAVLRTLVPLRSRPHSNASHQTQPPLSSRNQGTAETNGTGEEPDEHTFAERVLALLMLEVDEDAQDAGSTKLIHLADEVVREHRRLAQQGTESSSSPSSASRSPDEQTLRGTVDALLRPTNAVFVLLRRRLLQALTDALTIASRSSAEQRRVPESMHTGREPKRFRPDPHASGLGPGAYLRSPSGDAQPAEGRGHGRVRHAVDVPEGPARAALSRLKGYEDPVLRHSVCEALGALADIVDWAGQTWSGTPELGGLSTGTG